MTLLLFRGWGDNFYLCLQINYTMCTLYDRRTGRLRTKVLFYGKIVQCGLCDFFFNAGRVEKFHWYVSHMLLRSVRVHKLSSFCLSPSSPVCWKPKHFLCLNDAVFTWFASSCTTLMILKSAGFGDRDRRNWCYWNSAPVSPALQYGSCGPVYWSLLCEDVELYLGSDMQNNLAEVLVSDLILLRKEFTVRTGSCSV